MHGSFGPVALLEAVAINNHRQIVQPIVGGRHSRLPVTALLQFTIASQNEDAPALICQFGSESSSHSNWQTMTQGAGICLYARYLVAVRVPIQARKRLHERI